jgi:hypothetical protein
MLSKRQCNQSDRKLLSCLPEDIWCVLGSSSPFDMGSEEVGHFKRDYDLQFTRWTWLQADRAHKYVRVIEVAVYEAPPTRRN